MDDFKGIYDPPKQRADEWNFVFTNLLVRKVYVLTRQNEPSALMQEFTQLACSILKESVAPELIKIAPWLEQDIFVLDPTSGVMVDMTGKRADERWILSFAHD